MHGVHRGGEVGAFMHVEGYRSRTCMAPVCKGRKSDCPSPSDPPLLPHVQGKAGQPCCLRMEGRNSQA